jgi:hypothetical protein
MGAMYVSYGMSIILILVMTLLVHLGLSDLDLGVAVLIASCLYVPVVPMTWRYSRTLWMYFDYWLASDTRA